MEVSELGLLDILFLFSYSPDFLDRTAGFTADGLYEEAAPGEDWVTKCLLCANGSVHVLRLLQGCHTSDFSTM